MRNVRMQVAYDGARFFGWQRQDGFESVQGALEEAVLSLLGEVVSVQGAGRTDTGVHGLRQVAHCHLSSSLPDDRLRHALNAHLADGVVVRRLETCRDDFHARFDAIGKRYVYVVVTERFRPAFGNDQFHWINQPLDHGAMRLAARVLEGEHDFSAFATSGSKPSSMVRKVACVRLVARHGRFAIFVQGNGFLYNMVRAIAGTLIDVGRGRLSPDDVKFALESRDRSNAGPTAPAAGLYLLRVLYPRSERAFAGRDRGPSGVPGLFQY
ncbi:MAG: tRNA pseudouridine38-40 synthase [Chlamydiales bacterium]|jgi:tRNA pseudouridine38-40 synthase